MSEICCCELPGNAPFHSYDDVMHHLDSLGLFHMDMGLGRMESALRTLELDSPSCPAVQVVGTNGKGSTSAFLQSLAMSHGLRAGLYTSPHFVAPEERIRMNRRSLPAKSWPSMASSAVLAQPKLTYFELLTVMAALAFKSSGPDLMIFEAGLGGRYDATTALPVDMVCFVPMGMDHMNVLGDTLAAIVDDKSDALRPGVKLAVSAPQPKEAQDILEYKAHTKGIPLCSEPAPFGCGGTDSGRALWASLPEDLKALAVLPEDVRLGLNGPHQRMNAQTALLAWVLLCHRYGWKTDASTIRHGLEHAFIPGRLQFAPASDGRPALWLDGAHNAHGMAALVEALKTMPAEQRPGAAVFSCLGDKEPETLAAMLGDALKDAPVFVPTIRDNPRAAPGEKLAALFGSQARAAADLAEAIEEAARAAGGRPVLICGSLYLLGDVFAMWPELLEPAEQASNL